MLTDSAKHRLSRILVAIIVCLYIGSVPWFFMPNASSAITFGLPLWVIVALVSYFIIALLNAIAWYLSPIAESEGDRI